MSFIFIRRFIIQAYFIKCLILIYHKYKYKMYSKGKNYEKHLPKFIDVEELEQRVKLPLAHKDKVFTGIYLNNQRRKKRGGKIKCPEVKNKIEVYPRDIHETLHQCEVFWSQIRRYKKGEDKRKSQYKQKQQEFKPNEHKQKRNNNLNSNYPKTKYIEVKTEESKVTTSSNQIESKLQEVIPKYQKHSQHITKSDQESTELQISNQNTEYGNNNDPVDIEVNNNKESAQNSEQEEDVQINKVEDLEIIVARILFIKENPYKKPEKYIVCIVALEQRKNPKKIDSKSSLIAEIDANYYIDTIPINNKLPRFELDDIFNIENQLIDTLINDTKGLKLSKREKIQKLKEILHDHYFLIKYKYWSKDTNHPKGEIKKLLSKIKTPEGECQAFLHEFELTGYDHIQSHKIIQIQPTQLHKKFDGLVFTIDPATSVDLDDALSIDKLENGNYEVGVHIADVSSYLHLLDRKSISRLSTSVYLPHKVLHMLPPEFVQVCTLKPNVPRLSFSIFMQLDKQANVVSQRYEKLIIQSRCQLSYQMAQKIIDKKWTSSKDFPPKFNMEDSEAQALISKIKRLNKLALKMRSRRYIIDVFNNDQIKFQLDTKNYPIDINIHIRKQAEKMIEEFMILANWRVAVKLIRDFGKNSLMIHHPPPSDLNISFLNKSFQEYGINFNFKTMTQLQQQLKQHFDKKLSDQIQQLLILKASRVQELAVYKPYQQAQLSHFALNLKNYTHFTSPMRRFADVVVHEQLLKCLQEEKLTEKQLQRLTEEVRYMNTKRQATKRLKLRLIDSFFCLLIERKNAMLFTKAILHSFGLNSVTLFIAEYNMLKEVIWRDELQIDRVNYQENDKNTLQITFYDKKLKKKWQAKKHSSIDIDINCTRYCPLQIRFNFHVTIGDRPYKIYGL